MMGRWQSRLVVLNAAQSASRRHSFRTRLAAVEVQERRSTSLFAACYLASDWGWSGQPKAASAFSLRAGFP